MNFKITQRCIDLVSALIEAGYKGEIKITNGYATGTKEILGTAPSIQLSGFCKESMYLVEDMNIESLYLVGRYKIQLVQTDISVDEIAHVAWMTYQSYKSRDYKRPTEWDALFVKLGYLKEVTRVTLEEQ